MALRIRSDGRILCAAMHKEEPGDTYLDDAIHEMLCGFNVERTPVIGTEPMERHKEHGEWWWLGNVPKDVNLEPHWTQEEELCK